MSPSLPLNKVVTHGQLRIGFVAGHSVIPNSDPDALLITARQLDVDMLIWGGSHRVEAYQLEGKFFISPGSATGAFTTGWPEEDVDDETDAANGADVDNTDDHTTESNGTNSTKPPTSTDNDGQTTTTIDSDNKTGDNDDDADDDEHLDSTTPSFCLLDIQGSVCVLYIYSLIDGEVKVDKVSYRKDSP
ncbi:Vps29p [Sugiyamaella lignohabitans]|uniref:Vacuolar protein sorting-associated protein 29 n=1 Tax=Sugiyamaella lignohabitans TaxID=796027 RepID=A0A167E5Z6_9ASCO|nr:Vps29p [Sugiyamaella lignohabitans]ANB13684.1 Vps29p [Sugiyamaella lignohabitans]